MISTFPSAGEKVAKGSVVKVVISKGSEADAQVAVPTLTNRTESEAKSLLSAAGLGSGSVSQEYSDTVAEGYIISQNPSAGSMVDKGTNVSYVVSRGQENVYIGNAEKDGSSESAVTNYLTGKGLKVSRSEAYSDTVPKGNVISYNPGNGSTVAPGSTVNIVVSLGPEPVKTAQVPGAGADVNEITNRGFVVGNRTYEYSDSIAKDKIISCSPSGTQNVGTTINVVISRGVCLHPNVDASGKCTECGKTGLTPTNPTTPSEPTTPSDGSESSSGTGGQTGT